MACDGIGAPVGDGVMELARVTGFVRGDRADFHISGDTVKELRWHRRVTNIAAGDRYGSDFQRLLVRADMDLAPKTAFRTAMLAE